MYMRVRAGGKRQIFKKNLSQMATRCMASSHSIGFSRSTPDPIGGLMKAIRCHFAHKCATQQQRILQSLHDNECRKETLEGKGLWSMFYCTILYYILNTKYYILYTVYTICYTLFILDFMLYTLYCILCTLHYTLYYIMIT